MTTSLMHQRYIKYEDLIPCKAAFIDAKTPGSHLKDNFSIIGGGVTESKHQKVNLSLAHGFCIGAAGQPPKIRNSPHSHFTAEVFMVFKGQWRFYWNNDCGNETILNPGDIISLPTNMFRGFENVGDEYGLIFSILGHDDAGGGVIWAPQVIEEAAGHGLVLLENGKLVDTTIGETVPENIKPKAALKKEELAQFDQYTNEEMAAHVGRKNAYSQSTYSAFPNQTVETLIYYDIIGPLSSEQHNFHVKPGDPNGDQFNVYGMQTSGKASTGKYSREEVEVLLVHDGNVQVTCEHEGERIEVEMKAGDIFSFPVNATREIKSASTSFSYLVVGGDYPSKPNII